MPKLIKSKDVKVTVEESCQIKKTHSNDSKLNDVPDTCLLLPRNDSNAENYENQTLWLPTVGGWVGSCGVKPSCLKMIFFCNFNATNYPNQLYFIRGIWADDMGLGKTVYFI